MDNTEKRINTPKINTPSQQPQNEASEQPQKPYRREEETREHRAYEERIRKENEADKKPFEPTVGISDPEVGKWKFKEDCKNRWISDEYLKGYIERRKGHGDHLGSIVRIALHKDLDDERPIKEAAADGEAYIAYFRTKVPIRDIEKIHNSLLTGSLKLTHRVCCGILFLFGDREMFEKPEIFIRWSPTCQRLVDESVDPILGKIKGDFNVIK